MLMATDEAHRVQRWQRSWHKLLV